MTKFGAWLAALRKLPEIVARLEAMEAVVAYQMQRQQIEDAARFAGLTVVGDLANKDVKH